MSFVLAPNEVSGKLMTSSRARVKNRPMETSSRVRREAIVVRSPRPKVRSVQRPVLHRLGHMRRLDGLAARQVGDRARDFEDAVVSAGGEAETREGGIEEAARGGVKLA